MYHPAKLARTAAVAACLALAVAATAHAQGRGPGGPPPGGGGSGGGPGGGMNGGGVGGPQFPGDGGRGGGMGGGSIPNNVPPPQRAPSSSEGGSTRSGLQLGPPGQRWWDDHSFMKSLKLRTDQQTRMDAIFEQNRGTLLSRLENVQQAETQMQELCNSPVPDEGALFTQIDRVAQARSDLEKATTHMLLQIRREMDPDQIKRLESKR